MSKYRIVERTDGHGNSIFIEKRKRFLGIPYWHGRGYSDYEFGGRYIYIYDSVRDAKNKIDELLAEELKDTIKTTYKYTPHP